MNNRKIHEFFNEYTYYFIIAIASVFALTFLPMIGSSAGLAFDVPTTTVGWIVYVTLKLIVAALNVLIFHSFKCQAKVNVRDNEHYKEANTILGRIRIKEYHPRSPVKYQSQSYGKKGTTIFITTALGTVAITQAIITFDYVTLFTYLFTIVMGIVFGIMQMFKDEDYWTREYLDYAKLKEEEYGDNSKESSGTGTEEH